MNGVKHVSEYKWHVIRTNDDGSEEIAAWYDDYDKAKKEEKFLRSRGKNVRVEKNVKKVNTGK
jgi:hypothetical protein